MSAVAGRCAGSVLSRGGDEARFNRSGIRVLRTPWWTVIRCSVEYVYDRRKRRVGVLGTG